MPDRYYRKVKKYFITYIWIKHMLYNYKEIKQKKKKQKKQEVT